MHWPFQTSRQVRRAFDLLAGTHHCFLQEHTGSLYEHLLWDHLQAALLAASPPTIPMRILDAGAGTGLWATKLAGAGKQVFLLDISRNMLALSLGTEPSLTAHMIHVQADAQFLPFPTKSFDVVLAIGELINYVSDPASLLSELRRVTRSGGILFGTVANRMGILMSALRSHRWADADALLESSVFAEREAEDLRTLWSCSMSSESEPLLIRTCDIETLAPLLHSSGWTDVEQRPIGLLSTALTHDQVDILIRQRGLVATLQMECEIARIPGSLALSKEITFRASRH